MPKVYSDEKRLEIREQLMQTGVELIRQHGMKRMSIEELTRRVGIAQGTFYNFFRSKEVFVCEIARAYQEGIDTQVKETVRVKGGLDREDVASVYRRTFLEDQDSIFRYLSREDIQTILTRLPEGYRDRLPEGREAMMRLAEKVRGGKGSYDFDLIFNWIQILNLAVENKDMLSEVAFERTMNRIIDNLLDEIFESEKSGQNQEVRLVVLSQVAKTRNLD
jgi:AcrR family transcriptional regulator